MERQEQALEQGILASKRIRMKVQMLANAARARHGFLAHQDAIGLGILVVSAAAIIANGIAYGSNLLPAWLTIVIAALFMSLLHELEHDLIHRLYFRDRPFVHGAMMVLVWVFRPSTVNPFVRRDWHLHHHRASGTETDLEERGITNGERWGLRRLLMTVDSVLALALRPGTVRDISIGYARAQKPQTGDEYRRILWRNRLSFTPLANLYYAAWHFFLVVQLLEWVAPSWVPAWFAPVAPTLNLVTVVLLAPNALRSACLHFVSSNIHYYGDIDPRNVVQQTQVWTSLWVLPFQLFCFNFGSTHAIHHFVVQEPFYLRQMIAGEAHRVLRENGVRFNDFGTLLRANRWTVQVPSPQVA